VRRVQARSGAIGATEPFANVGMLAPSGVMPFSGGAPSHGASIRVLWPNRDNELAKPIT
jgi:hypothetical protein